MLENAKLRNDIEQLRNQLLEKERKRGGMFCLMFLERVSCYLYIHSQKRLCLPAAGIFDVSCCSLEHCLVFTINDNISGIWPPLTKSWRCFVLLEPCFPSMGTTCLSAGVCVDIR